MTPYLVIKLPLPANASAEDAHAIAKAAKEFADLRFKPCDKPSVTYQPVDVIANGGISK